MNFTMNKLYWASKWCFCSLNTEARGRHMAKATFLQYKKLLNLLELAKGSHNYFQMENSHKFPFSCLTHHFLIPSYIFSTSSHTRMSGQTPTLSILKFFPTPEPVAQTRLLFQYRDYFVIGSWISNLLFFSVNMNHCKQICCIF